MSALYCALWESIELLSLAGGRVRTTSAPSVKGRPGKAGCAAFSGGQLREDRKLLIFIMDLETLVLTANFKFTLQCKTLVWSALNSVSY